MRTDAYSDPEDTYGEPSPASGEPLERIERELTLLVRRAQKVHLHARAPVEPLERAAYAILGILCDEGPMRVGGLAGRFHLDASTVSRQVATLVEVGLVVREPDPADGRAYQLRLTSHGKESLQATRAGRRRVVRELLGSWSQRDRATFALLLERFNTGLDSQLPGAEALTTGCRPTQCQ